MEIDNITNTPIATNTQVNYTYVDSISAGLSISSSGLATCTGTCISTSSTYSVELHVTLRNENGLVQTWTTTSNRYASLSETYYVSSGHTYYVYVYARVYSNGTQIEAASKTSNSVYF